MAETTADVRRDIELTRERMSDTLAQLEQKFNVMQVVRDHPWPTVALAAGAGFLLARSRLDAKAAAATVAATGGASSKLGTVLDDAAARVIDGVSGALQDRVDEWVSELKNAIGAPRDRAMRADRALAHESVDDGREMGGTAQGADRASTSRLAAADNTRVTGTPLGSSRPR